MKQFRATGRPRGRTVPLVVAAVSWLVAVLAVILVAGCGDDLDEVQVDFGRRQPVRSAAADSTALTVAVAAMTGPQETFYAYRDLLDYLGQATGRPVRLVQRRTYAEINDLLIENRLDVGFICSGAYMEAMDTGKIQLLAAPVVAGELTYRSYLIVAAANAARSLADLRGKRFAFTDPLSLTGCLYPRLLLRRMGSPPDGFFASTIYTHGHDKAIQAVAKGMVQGACVDGLVFEYIRRRRPAVIEQVRIVEQSPPFGIPPVVVPAAQDPELTARLRACLLGMQALPAGRRILDELMIDRFEAVGDSLYAPGRALLEEIDVGVDGRPAGR